MTEDHSAAAFIERWQGVKGSERANYQMFVADLCRLLAVPEPEPARDDTRDNAYVFERRVTFAHGDGSASAGFIDCYRRGAFVLEARPHARRSPASPSISATRCLQLLALPARLLIGPTGSRQRKVTLRTLSRGMTPPSAGF